MQTIEGEIERRIAILNDDPIMRFNSWRVSVSQHYFSGGARMCTVFVLAGYKKVFDITRDHDSDMIQAITQAFDEAHKKLAKLDAT